MKNIELFFYSFILFVLLTGTGIAASQNRTDNDLAKAKETVETFCKSEFDGDEFVDRAKIIKFSAEREKSENERSGWASPWVVFWDWDPFYVVSSYKILSVDVEDFHGSAIVEYKLVAESKGKGNIIVSSQKDCIVNLKLVYDRAQWWVLDPPLPKISLGKIIKIYEGKLKAFDDKWLAHASKAQMKSYERTIGALKILKTLQN